MQNPFTTTFSKAPEYTYIATEKTDVILENFNYENPSRDMLIQIAAMLTIELSEAREMAKITKGYAYAFHELGVLYFKKKSTEKLDDLIPLLKSELFAYSYEKIWEKLTEADRFLVSLLIDKNEYKREEVLKKMGDREGNILINLKKSFYIKK